MENDIGLSQRSAGSDRTSIENGALRSSQGRFGARGCKVIDISDNGARLRTHDLSVLPNSFKVTLHSFLTIRCCRLIWRGGDFLGVASDRKGGFASSCEFDAQPGQGADKQLLFLR